MMRYLTVTFTASIILAVSASLSYAVVYPFDIFTSTTGFGFGGPNEDDPRINFSVEVFNDSETVAFRFCNQSSSGDPDLLDLSIIAIYFDNQTSLGAPQITNQTGYTNFLEGANPPELQTEEIIDFQTTDSFSADSDGSGITTNGINPGEWVTINFNLCPGTSFEDVINQINNANIRIGIRVMFLPDGENESAVNVPEPAAIAMLSLGTLLMLSKRRPGHKK